MSNAHNPMEPLPQMAEAQPPVQAITEATESVVPNQMSAETRLLLLANIARKIREHSNYRTSQLVDDVFRPAGIDWRRYAQNNEGLSMLITRIFPELAVDHPRLTISDGIAVTRVLGMYLDGSLEGLCGMKPDPDAMAASVNDWYRNPKARAEITEARVLFRPTMYTIQGLQKLTELQDVPDTVWEAWIVHAFFKALYGLVPMYLNPEKKHLAFPIGLFSAAEEEIYCVLLLRSHTEAVPGRKRPWRIAHFCTAGTCQNWLRNMITEDRRPSVVGDSARDQIMNRLNSLVQLQVKLLGAMGTLQEQLSQGAPVAEHIREQLSSYFENWDQLQQDLHSANLLEPQPLSLEAILSHPQLTVQSDQPEPPGHASQENLITSLFGGILPIPLLNELYPPANDLEKMILAGKEFAIGQILHDKVHMAVMGYNDRQRQRILERFYEWKKNPSNLSLRALDTAHRLDAILGDDTRQTERVLLLGILTNPQRVLPRLLDYYRQHGKQELFLMVCSQMKQPPDPGDNLTYLFQILAKNIEALRAYLEERFCLIYNQNVVKALLEVLRDIPDVPERAALDAQLAMLQNWLEPNEFEQCLIRGNRAEVAEFLADPQRLLDLGYNPESIQDMETAFRNEACISGDQPLDAAVRLLNFQGNLHGIAEHILWDSLSREELGAAFHLLVLLAGEARWETCISLYERFKSQLQTRSECRKAYLQAMLSIDPESAEPILRSYLQDFLENSELLALIPPDMPLCSAITELKEHLTDPLDQAIVYQADTLRELVTDQQSLVRLGVEKSRSEVMADVYRKGHYARNGDALSIANRLYQFQGNRNGTAQRFAEFALPDSDAVQLLWTIHRSANRSDACCELMQQYPQLLDTHLSDFCEFLFQTGRYEQYLEYIDRSPVTDSAEGLRKQLAHAHIRKETDKIIDLTNRLGIEKSDFSSSANAYLSALAENAETDADGLLHMLEQSRHSYQLLIQNDRLRRHLTELCVRQEDVLRLLRLLVSMIRRNPKPGEAPLMTFFYDTAVWVAENNWLPEDLAVPVEQRCRSRMQPDSAASIPAAYCLFVLMRHTGHALKAAFALRFLTQSRERMDGPMLQRVEELEKSFLQNDPVHKLLFTLVTPQDHVPHLSNVQNLVLQDVLRGDTDSAKRMLTLILNDCPDNSGIASVLLALCKDQSDETLWLIRRCLNVRTPFAPKHGLSHVAVKKLHILNAVEAKRRSLGTHTIIVLEEELQLPDSAYLQKVMQVLNQCDDSLAPMACSLLLCLVTGEWAGFLHQAWMTQFPLGEFLSAEIFPQDNLPGFFRALLLLTSRLGSRRKKFLHWLQCQVKAISASKSINQMHGLINDGILDKADPQMFRYPFEERTLAGGLYSALVEDSADQREALHIRSLLAALMDDTVTTRNRVYQHAATVFQAGDDNRAYGLFKTLYYLCNNKLFQHYHLEFKGITAENIKIAKSNWKARYQCYMYISGAFANLKGATVVFRKNFPASSCISMTIALACTPRANEMDRLRDCFAEENRKVCSAVCQLLDPAYSDREKLMIVTDFADKKVQTMLLMMLLRRNNSKCFLLTTPEGVKQAFELQQQLKSDIPKKLPYILLTLRDIRYDILKKIGSGHSPIAANEPMFQPAYLQRLHLPEEADGPDRQDAMQMQYDVLARNDYDKRLELSGRMYSVAVSEATDEKLCLDRLIQLSLDYALQQMAQRSRVEQCRTEAAQAVLDAARCIRRYRPDRSRPGYILFQEKAADAMGIVLKYRSHTLRGLLEDYGKHEQEYTQIRVLLSDAADEEAAEHIFDVLDLLSDSDDSQDGWLNLLNSARKRLGQLHNSDWKTVSDRLYRMIEDEIQKLTCRADPKIQILSATADPENGTLFGQVHNMGKGIARDLKLQVSITGNETENFELTCLHPGAKALFSVPYFVSPEDKTLHYSIALTFDGGEHQTGSKLGDLKVLRKEEPKFRPKGLYNISTIVNFEVDADGHVQSPELFGREEEKAALRDLYRGTFINYKSAVVRGLRRSGKSSLLNYALQYTTHNCKDAVSVMVDCQNIHSTTHPIQHVFVAKVLDQIPLKIQGLPNRPDLEWEMLVERWSLPDIGPDRDPTELSLFYRELYAVTGVGLILMIDEVDVLFHAVSESAGLDAALFPSIGSMCCTMEDCRVVHFVLCGSNRLLRYETDGGLLNQMFQRVGARIDVGQLRKNEIEDMLLAPTKDHPDLHYPKETLEWIWRYTGGLVWFTKLVAEKMLELAHEAKRSTLYPSDAMDAIPAVAQRVNCEQFYEGTLLNDRLVLNALQSQSDRWETFVPREMLSQLLENEMTDTELRDSLEMLKSLRLIEERRHMGRMEYRFRIELYRIFFRNYRDDRFREFAKREVPEQFDWA